MNFIKNLMCNFSKMKGTLLISAVAFSIGFASCSDDEFNPSTGDGVDDYTVETSDLNVISDSDYLSRYVTNYGARSRSVAESETLYMPIACPSIPEAAVEYDDINFYYWGGEISQDQALTAKVTKDTEKGLINIGTQNIYVSANFTIVGANGTDIGSGPINIYVLPGGSITFKGNYNNGLPYKVANSQLTIYNWGSLYAANTYAPCNLESFTLHSATLVDIDDLGIGTGTKLYAYDGIVCDDLNVYVGAEVYVGCKLVANKSLTIDSGSAVSTGYVSSPLITLKGNPDAATQHLILRNGGLWESDKINMTNVDHIWVGSDTDSYSCINAAEISVNDIDLTGTFNTTFINCTKWTGDNRAADMDNLKFNSTVSLNDASSLEVVSDDDTSCAPKYVKPIAPPVDPEDNPVLKLISKVEMPDDHTHPISATCIDIVGNQAFVSWHERGGNIKGCIEWLDITSPDAVTFKAWMESDKYTYGGTKADDAYDFNHLIYDAATNSIITVGDHSKKGGFVGQIKLADITPGSKGQPMSILIPRQLPIAQSGNAVVVRPSDRALLIACAGGYNIFPFGDGSKFALNKKGYTLASECETSPTSGSAKHIAMDGNTLVTVEYTAGADKVGDPYWDDTETSLPAKISVWDTGTWLKEGSLKTSWEVPNFAPIYGKDVIAIDNDVVYSCQGRNGVVAYDMAGNIKASFNVNDFIKPSLGFTADECNKMRNSAANGLCVKGNYVFVANGGAGVWVLNKSDLTPVAHFTDAGKYLTNQYPEPTQIGASANYVRVTDDNYVYVAYGLGGVMVLKFDPSAI